MSAEEKGLILDSRWTHYGRLVPTRRVCEGVYIDDRAVVAVIRAGAVQKDRQLVSEIVADTEQAYAGVGLVRHQAKEIRDAESAVIWGCSVDGKRRVVRSDACKQIGEHFVDKVSQPHQVVNNASDFLGRPTIEPRGSPSNSI